MSNWWDPTPSDSFCFNYDTEFSTEHKFDTYVDYDKYVDIKVDVEVDPWVEGNTAQFNIDVQALGDDGFAELNLTVVTTDYVASIVATGISVVD